MSNILHSHKLTDNAEIVALYTAVESSWFVEFLLKGRQSKEKGREENFDVFLRRTLKEKIILLPIYFGIDEIFSMQKH